MFVKLIPRVKCKNVLTYIVLISVCVPFLDCHNVYVRRQISARERHKWCNDSESYLISTPGCTIPNYMTSIKFDEAKHQNLSCPTRIVYVNKVADYLIKFHISWPIIEVAYKMANPTPGNFTCRYQFVNLDYQYSKSEPFKDGQEVILDEETLTVKCVALGPRWTQLFLYTDYYLILKKKTKNIMKNRTKKEKGAKKRTQWNVLMLGIDTMSRARAFHSLPKTIKYLQSYDWLDFRAYSKVGFRTFENIVPLLTGLPPPTTRICVEKMKILEQNAHRFIWNRFKEAGYVTAFGETHMETFDEFHQLEPTDHYVRRSQQETWKGNYICSGSMFPERHLFDYILQFVRTYKNYFGFFFSNSFTHDYPATPSLLDKHLIEFFEQLRQTMSWNRTFVFFFSDHGVTYGGPRNDKQKEFYYEERLPMLFIRVPDDFKESFPDEYFSMQWNQNRLTSVYDLHATVSKILSHSTSTRQGKPEACPKITGLTEKISPKRTCKDACISEIYCTCQCLIKAGNTWITRKSLNIAVSNVQRVAQAIKTDIKCTKCAKLKHRRTNRIHYYTRGNKTWFIVNFDVSPGYKSFEAIVLYDGQRFTHIATEITKAMVDQKCVYNYENKVYCECVKDSKCQ